MARLTRYSREVAFVCFLTYICVLLSVHVLHPYSQTLINPSERLRSLGEGSGHKNVRPLKRGDSDRNRKKDSNDTASAALSSINNVQDEHKQSNNSNSRTHIKSPQQTKPSQQSYRYGSVLAFKNKHHNSLHTANGIFTNLTNSNKAVNKLDTKLHEWKLDVKQQCSGKIKVFHGMIVIFPNLTLNPEKCDPTGSGVENIPTVLPPAEETEYLSPVPGCFSIDCDKMNFSAADFSKSAVPKHFISWFKSITNDYGKIYHDNNVYNTHFTIAIVRYEYANVYWNIMDLYDAFITASLNNVPIHEADVLIMDGHPRGHLDHLWTKTFNSVKRPRDLYNNRVTFKEFSWLFGRDVSPLLTKSLTRPPKWLEFRKEVLTMNRIQDDHQRICGIDNDSVKNQSSIHGITSKEAGSIKIKTLLSNSSNVSVSTDNAKLRVLLIWRRDYIAHPRNPTGLIMRKIKNEKELERSLRTAFPAYFIRGVQLDKLSIDEQLYLFSHSDILIGMHGAALAFSVFMPPGSAVIELYPSYYQGYNWHMEYIATWSGHAYKQWKNKNTKLDNSTKGYSTVPPAQVISLVHDVNTVLCPS